MQTPWTNSVRTLEQARDFVLEVRMCGVLHDSKGALPTLWDAVDAPDKQRGEGGWGDKMDKVWTEGMCVATIVPMCCLERGCPMALVMPRSHIGPVHASARFDLCFRSGSRT